MIKIFRNIGKLVTLKKATEKKSRNIMFQDLSILKNSALVSENGIIKWIGPNNKIPPRYAKEKLVKEIDLQKKLVLPGFVECHTHLVFAGERSKEFELRNQGVSYSDITKSGGGIYSTVKDTQKISEQALLELSQKRVNNFIKQGVTTLEIKSGYGLKKSAELKMLRVINNLKGPDIFSTFLGAHALDRSFENTNDYIKHIIKHILPEVKKQKLSSRVDIFIDKGFFNNKNVEDLFNSATQLGFDLTIHTEQLTRSGGVIQAIKHNAKSADHLVKLNAKDISELAQSNITAVLLPGADFYLDIDYPNARSLLDKGARVALATDFNPGSCPTQDLSLIGFLARQKMKMKLEEVLVAYTLSASYALGVEAKKGSLVVGKHCDFTVLDCDLPDLFYSIGFHPVLKSFKKANLQRAF